MTLEWVQQPTWIAVFDILGYRGLLADAEKSFPRALLTSKLKELFAVLEGEISSHASTEYLVLSDTFVVLAPDLSIQRYPWFLHLCEALIRKSVTIEIPLRGAISAGPVLFSRSPQMLLGSAFLEAYEYQEDQDWIGLVLAPSAISLVRASGLEPQHHDFVADPAIPLRKYDADAVLAYRFQNGRSSFANPLLRHLRAMLRRAPESAAEKYRRTIAFIERHHRSIPSHA